jgi:Tfp pilus assembly protein PilF
MHWANYAIMLHRASDPEAAEAACRQAIDLAPDEVCYQRQLGELLLSEGETERARDVLLAAVARAPTDPVARLDAAHASIACGDAGAAEVLREWRQWRPDDDALRYQLADLLAQVDQMADARELLEELVQRHPDDARACLLLAKVCERVNRAGDAATWLAHVEQTAAAGNADVRREITLQRARLAMRERDFNAARTLLEQAGPAHTADAGYYFALAGACDGLADSAAALRALELAHAMQVERLRVMHPALVDPDSPALASADSTVAADAYANWPSLQAPDADQSPIFVVGFPRSGTTLVEQMLDAHPQLQSTDERPVTEQLTAQLTATGVTLPHEISRLDQRDCDELRKGYWVLACRGMSRHWDQHLVDKNPMNLLHLPLLHRMFPHARFIAVVRDPRDVVVSCYLQHFRALPLQAACRSWPVLADAYVRAMRHWLHHAGLMQVHALTVRYEDLLADTPAWTQKMADFLELDHAEAMRHFARRAREKGYIATPSYAEVIEPVHARSVDRWQRYRESVDPVIPTLQPMIDYWGYLSAPPATAPGV